MLSRRVQAVAGFSWGFTIAAGDMTFASTTRLEPSDGDGQLELLRASYPSWVFDGGFVS